MSKPRAPRAGTRGMDIAKAPPERSTVAPNQLDEDFEAWVRPHWDAIQRVVLRLVPPMDRDDVLQNTVLRAWRARKRFDPDRGSARTWLLTIAANESKHAWRWLRRHETVDDWTAQDHDGTTEESLDLQRAIRLLPRRQRLATELHYYVGLTVHEVAIVIGCSEGTVKATLFAARRNLRKTLGNDYCDR